MKNYYECHITIECKFPLQLKKAIENCGWKYSVIAPLHDDPDLGEGARHYAIRHYSNTKAIKDVLMVMTNVEQALLQNCEDIKILRKKIELVIYDVKT